jgi:hypothetical protein
MLSPSRQCCRGRTEEAVSIGAEVVKCTRMSGYGYVCAACPRRLNRLAPARCVCGGRNLARLDAVRRRIVRTVSRVLGCRNAGLDMQLFGHLNAAHLHTARLRTARSPNQPCCGTCDLGGAGGGQCSRHVRASGDGGAGQCSRHLRPHLHPRGGHCFSPCACGCVLAVRGACVPKCGKCQRCSHTGRLGATSGIYSPTTCRGYRSGEWAGEWVGESDCTTLLGVGVLVGGVADMVVG